MNCLKRFPGKIPDRLGRLIITTLSSVREVNSYLAPHNSSSGLRTALSRLRSLPDVKISDKKARRGQKAARDGARTRARVLLKTVPLRPQRNTAFTLQQSEPTREDSEASKTEPTRTLKECLSTSWLGRFAWRVVSRGEHRPGLEKAESAGRRTITRGPEEGRGWRKARTRGRGVGLTIACRTPVWTYTTCSCSAQARAWESPELPLSRLWVLLPWSFNPSHVGEKWNPKDRQLLGTSTGNKQRRWGPLLAPKFKGINSSGAVVESGAASGVAAMVKFFS